MALPFIDTFFISFAPLAGLRFTIAIQLNEWSAGDSRVAWTMKLWNPSYESIARMRVVEDACEANGLMIHERPRRSHRNRITS